MSEPLCTLAEPAAVMRILNQFHRDSFFAQLSKIYLRKGRRHWNMILLLSVLFFIPGMLSIIWVYFSLTVTQRAPQGEGKTSSLLKKHEKYSHNMSPYSCEYSQSVHACSFLQAITENCRLPLPDVDGGVTQHSMHLNKAIPPWPACSK